MPVHVTYDPKKKRATKKAAPSNKHDWAAPDRRILMQGSGLLSFSHSI